MSNEIPCKYCKEFKSKHEKFDNINDAYCHIFPGKKTYSLEQSYLSMDNLEYLEYLNEEKEKAAFPSVS